MKRVRTALVGCGKVGQIHAQAWRPCPNPTSWRPATSMLQRATSLPRVSV